MFESIHGLAFRFAACGANNSFFSFPTWYKYLKDSSGPLALGERCSVAFNFPGDIPLILLAVLEILLRIAGLAAIVYVIYGGVQYVVSQGEPDKISRAKGTIINALAGMIIATLAVAFVSFIGNSIG